MSHLITSERVKWGIVIGSSLIIADLLRRYLKNHFFNDDKIPTAWRKVGEVTDLVCYPIKSGGWIYLNEVDCAVVGFEKGNMRDRTFMIISEETGVFVTARKYPKLIQITPKFHGDVMTLTAPGMSSINIDFATLLSSRINTTEVWDEKVKTHDAGDEVAKWISMFILNESSGLRLVYFSSKKPTRNVRKKNKVFETAVRADTGALHDATSYMLINEASVEDLNTRIEKAVAPLWFRPNIVVKGPKAYEEDSWTFMKFGDGTIFKNVKPCTRCIFTTIDPETAEKDPEEEPLKTLRKYRKIEKGGESPVLGIHLGVRKEGKIKIGDPVYIAA